jgi:hypothetical protein
MLDEKGKSSDDYHWPLQEGDHPSFFIPFGIVILGVIGIVVYLTWDLI